MFLIFCIVLTLALWKKTLGFAMLPSYRGTFEDKFPKLWIRRLSVLGLPLGFLGHILLCQYQAFHDGIRDIWFHQIPIAIVFNALPFGDTTTHEMISFAIVCTVCIQVAALIGLSLTTNFRTLRKGIYVAIPLTFLAIIAVFSPVMTTSDPYNYVVAGLRGMQAYNNDLLVIIPFQFLERYVPIRGSIYGPLWMIVNSSIVWFGSTLFAKIVALRIFNVGLILFGSWILHRMKFKNAVIIAYLFNPFLWWYWVVDAHNDALPITIALAAVGLARRLPYITMILIAMAGAIKIPFLLIGSMALMRERSLMKRLAYITGSTVICLGISWIWGGELYLHNFDLYLHYRRHTNSSFYATILIYLPALGSLLCAALFFFRRTLFPPFAFIFGSASPLSFPWYLAWGLPYGVVARRHFEKTLYFLPLLGVLADDVYQLDIVLLGFFIAIVIAFSKAILERKKIAI